MTQAIAGLIVSILFGINHFLGGDINYEFWICLFLILVISNLIEINHSLK